MFLFHYLGHCEEIGCLGGGICQDGLWLVAIGYDILFTPAQALIIDVGQQLNTFDIKLVQLSDPGQNTIKILGNGRKAGLRGF